jgi:hypothetical protein
MGSPLLTKAQIAKIADLASTTNLLLKDIAKRAHCSPSAAARTVERLGIPRESHRSKPKHSYKQIVALARKHRQVCVATRMGCDRTTVKAAVVAADIQHGKCTCILSKVSGAAVRAPNPVAPKPALPIAVTAKKWSEGRDGYLRAMKKAKTPPCYMPEELNSEFPHLARVSLEDVCIRLRGIAA